MRGVLSESGEHIQGLFCTGEMVWVLFYNNYPVAGTVFGMKADRAPARLA